jgi:hypothetical protein
MDELKGKLAVQVYPVPATVIEVQHLKSKFISKPPRNFDRSGCHHLQELFHIFAAEM